MLGSTCSNRVPWYSWDFIVPWHPVLDSAKQPLNITSVILSLYVSYLGLCRQSWPDLPTSSSFVLSVQRTFSQLCGLSICILANSSLAFLCPPRMFSLKSSLAQTARHGVIWHWCTSTFGFTSKLFGGCSGLFADHILFIYYYFWPLWVFPSLTGGYQQFCPGVIWWVRLLCMSLPVFLVSVWKSLVRFHDVRARMRAGFSSSLRNNSSCESIMHQQALHRCRDTRPGVSMNL